MDTSNQHLCSEHDWRRVYHLLYCLKNFHWAPFDLLSASLAFVLLSFTFAYIQLKTVFLFVSFCSSFMLFKSLSHIHSFTVPTIISLSPYFHYSLIFEICSSEWVILTQTAAWWVFAVLFGIAAFNALFNLFELLLKLFYSGLREFQFYPRKKLWNERKARGCGGGLHWTNFGSYLFDKAAHSKFRIEQICLVIRSSLAINTYAMNDDGIEELFLHVLHKRSLGGTMYNGANFL